MVKKGFATPPPPLHPNGLAKKPIPVDPPPPPDLPQANHTPVPPSEAPVPLAAADDELAVAREQNDKLMAVIERLENANGNLKRRLSEAEERLGEATGMEKRRTVRVEELETMLGQARDHISKLSKGLAFTVPGNLSRVCYLKSYNFFHDFGISLRHWAVRSDSPLATEFFEKLFRDKRLMSHPDRNFGNTEMACLIHDHVKKVAEIMCTYARRAKYNELLERYRVFYGKKELRYYIPHGGPHNIDWHAMELYLSGKRKTYECDFMYISGPDSLPILDPPDTQLYFE